MICHCCPRNASAVLAAITWGHTHISAIEHLVTTFMTLCWGACFLASDITVNQQLVCTNNDVESRHSRLNRRGVHANIQFYPLVELLEIKSRLLSVQTNLVCMEDVTWMHRHSTRTIACLWCLWNSYASVQSFVKAEGKLICSSVDV